MTAATASKVSRLLAEKRVTPRGAASVYDIQGDSGRYRVVLGEDFSSCTCPAHGTCSHMTAARLLHDAIDDDRRAQHAAKKSPGLVEAAG
jgi:uncharacterized Zn finger protein